MEDLRPGPRDLRPLLVRHGARPEAAEALVLGEAVLWPGTRSCQRGDCWTVTSRADLDQVAALESHVWAQDWSWLADHLQARLAAPAPVQVLLVEDQGAAVSAAWLVPLADPGSRPVGREHARAYRGRGIYGLGLPTSPPRPRTPATRPCRSTPPTTASPFSNGSDCTPWAEPSPT